MTIWGQWALIAALAILSSPASANISIYQCIDVDGCTFIPEDGIFVTNSDYTLFTNGKKFRFIFTLESLDPSARFYLDEPNQVDNLSQIRTVDGLTRLRSMPVQYTFDQSVKPLLTTILIKTPRTFDYCDTPGPLGQVCSVDYNVWGNRTSFVVSANSPVTMFFRTEPVPEPLTWAMMLIGFGLTGLTVRHHQRRLLKSRGLVA